MLRTYAIRTKIREVGHGEYVAEAIAYNPAPFSAPDGNEIEKAICRSREEAYLKTRELSKVLVNRIIARGDLIGESISL